jgi:hypothetical protein
VCSRLEIHELIVYIGLDRSAVDDVVDPVTLPVRIGLRPSNQPGGTARVRKAVMSSMIGLAVG